MDYKQRLIAAARFVRERDLSAAEEFNVDPAEFGVRAKLKPHQFEGLSWLIRRYNLGVNVVLGDEMGLGKTLQSISLLSYLKMHLNSPGPFLVLCPLSVIDGWESEVANFTPNLKLLRYVGEKDHRRHLRWKMHEYVVEESVPSRVTALPFDVLLTTYDIALIDQDFLSQFPWHYAIIDEAHRLKNPSSVLYNVLRDRFVMPRRLLMTGTPIQNNLTELWSLMHFCMPLVYGTLDEFLSVFSQARDPSYAGKVKDQFKILRYVLGAFMLRRTKDKLIESGALSLPPVTEITVMTPLSPLQKKIYVSILRKELPKLLALASGSSNAQSLHNIVIQLRKACSHPYLFPGIEPEPYQEGEHLVQASGKLLVLDQLLQKLHDSGHRVLLFAQMTHTLDILQDFVELRKYTYERLDGSIRAEERFAAIRNFSQSSIRKTDDHDAYKNNPFIFLISTRAGGVGLNLMAADTVIFYEQDWNPQVDKQALQRAHRIGQSKHVLSISLVTGQTIEEVILRRSQRKLQLSRKVTGDFISDDEGRDAEGAGLKSVIFGLQVFDIAGMDNNNCYDQLDNTKVSEIAEKAIASRYELQPDLVDKKFEINSVEIHDLNPAMDEASYQTWVEKFKQTSAADDSVVQELGSVRALPDEKRLKAKAAHQKAMEKKLAKWESLGYHSLSVGDPLGPGTRDLLLEAGAVHFVYGDCTDTAVVAASEPTIIFSCVDDSGSWGHGGLFDALARLSDAIPHAYERASEFKDLHLGDLHLLEITDNLPKPDNHDHARQWVALAVVQSYNPRRNVPRSAISIADLEVCLEKASFSAVQSSASIHMPRINYGSNSDRSEWYTVERLLRKYAALYGIHIYVYYFRRSV